MRVDWRRLHRDSAAGVSSWRLHRSSWSSVGASVKEAAGWAATPNPLKRRDLLSSTCIRPRSLTCISAMWVSLVCWKSQQNKRCLLPSNLQRHTPGLKEEEQSCFCWFFCLCFSSPLRTSFWNFSPKILLIGMANRLSLVTGGKLTGDPTPVWKTLALSVTLWPSCICFGKLPSPLAGLTV